MKVGAEAMRENKISIEEVDLCLEDLDTSIRSINQVDELLGNFFRLCFEFQSDI